MEDALPSLTETRDLTTFLLNQLDDKDLIQSVALVEPGLEVDILYLLHALVEHQVHHRGENIPYSRMMGRRPPRRSLDDDPE